MNVRGRRSSVDITETLSQFNEFDNQVKKRSAEGILVSKVNVLRIHAKKQKTLYI